MDLYESLSDYSEKDIKHGLSLVKKLGGENNTSYSSDCSCSDCANDSDSSSDACYSGDCSCSDCVDSSDCDGAAVCALGPKPKKRTGKNVKSGRKTQARQQQACRGGVCPLVRKPKKAPAKKKKVTRKPAKKSPRAKKSSCYCCYDCC